MKILKAKKLNSLFIYKTKFIIIDIGITFFKLLL